MLTWLATHPAVSAIGFLVITLVSRFLLQGYRIRSQLHKAPGPPHSWLFGHLKIMGEALQGGDIPLKAHPHVAQLWIQKKYNLDTYFYLDLWPVADSMLVVFNPELGSQFTTDHSSPKHRSLPHFMRHLAGEGDLVSSNGPYWKRWRSIFNPGFAASHLMTLVPGIVDDTIVYATKLAEKAQKGEIFRLEEETTRLTVDIIGKVSLDLQLNTQLADNTMVTALREQVHLLPNGGTFNPFEMWSPGGIYRRWRNVRVMNDFLSKVLDDRFAQTVNQPQSSNANENKPQRKRAIIDLALEAFRAEQGASSSKSTALDPEFKRNAMTQIRTFLFAGHDTTSSTICYVLYLLSKDSSALANIRAEHSSVLGPQSSTPDVIKASPHVLNALPYTTAVIKETLRLFPAASSVRAPDPSFTLRDPRTGEVLPTPPHLMLWLVHFAMHRTPTYWGSEANDFNPSRFLPENSASLPDAWRPFERGNRNCIGQDLAMLEARIVLALVVRRFDFAAAFDRVGESVLAGDGSWYASDPAWRKGKQDLEGEVAYPVLIGAAKPREGMPVTVTERVDEQ